MNHKVAPLLALLSLAPLAQAQLAAIDPAEVLAHMRPDPITGQYVSHLPDGRRAVTTLDPRLQRSMDRLLELYDVPYGAVVALDPSTGRVLAAAEHGSDGAPRGRAFTATFPAASIFKLVTGAALLQEGIGPDVSACYHGGKRGITAKSLENNPRKDRSCATLTTAMGHSINMVFAKLASAHLAANSLRAVAERFLFNGSLAFASPPGVAVLPTELGKAFIPEDPLGLAQTAAGFGPVQLTALHAAWITGAIANGGSMRPPMLVSRIEGMDSPPYDLAPAITVLDKPELAAALTQMMEVTVRQGTARQAFRERRRWALGKMLVAGKTGSLFGKRPFRDYTWFVGFAPADDPQIAVGVIMVNALKWKVHAPYIGRETMRAFFAGRGRRLASAETWTEVSSDPLGLPDLDGDALQQD